MLLCTPQWMAAAQLMFLTQLEVQAILRHAEIHAPHVVSTLAALPQAKLSQPR